MRNWKKYVGWSALVFGLLLAAQLGWAWRQQVAKQRAEASHDPLLLPSRSRQLMPLADTLDWQERETLLRRYDIASLWLLRPESPVQNGFVGLQHQRLEVVFKRVRQNEQQPGLFHVQGLMRLRHQITPLRGTIHLQQIRRYGHRGYNNSQQPVYTAVGQFAFWSGAEKKKILSGTTAIDFSASPEKGCALHSDYASIARNSRLFAFEGYYEQAGKRQEALWAAELVLIGNEVLGDFTVGGRAVDINPKYARYGWNEYYDPEEWWDENKVTVEP
ncbi:hypothetical protein [Hymenobacter lucidus]|uniref:Uncharacterized protein n=1 Tax=Hymenobacter lucidus TaxID=2880930 RepID=A0ABS8AUA9_9BACT|nr:hypothetical protein [Hymenobacter lucidus]MCB2408632.1 hypothetical protein [Hymenobacter lucidus]